MLLSIKIHQYQHRPSSRATQLAKLHNRTQKRVTKSPGGSWAYCTDYGRAN